MKRNLFMMLVGLSLMSGLFSCQQPAEKPAKEMPMFCTWYTYTGKENLDSIFQSFSELGIDGVGLNAGTAEEDLPYSFTKELAAEKSK